MSNVTEQNRTEHDIYFVYIYTAHR